MTSGRDREKTIKSTQVADLILSYIITHRLKSSDKLPPEEELAEQAGVSRVSIREGMQGLKFLGFLKSSPGRGTEIAEIDFSILSRCLAFQIAASPPAFEQLLEARMALELGNVEFICGRIEPEKLRALRAAADCGRKNNTSDEELKRSMNRDHEFHRLLIESGGNAVLAAYTRMLDLFFSVRQAQRLTDPRAGTRQATSRCVTEEHHLLLDAVETGDKELARGIMRRHLNRYFTFKEEK